MTTKKALNKAMLALAAALVLAVPLRFAEAAPNVNNPTCVLMKFTDDTRYDAIESAAILSDLVMEKMVTSKRFNLKETRPLDEDMEARLYDEKADELKIFNEALKNNDFNALFEGGGFADNKAQTISSAAVGQFVTPEITAKIGAEHGADYLVQGTIINLGTGRWWNEEDFSLTSAALNVASQLAASYAANALGGLLGPLGQAGFDLQKSGIGVQCDIRIIRAATGEVIWVKRVTEKAEHTAVGMFGVTIGQANLSANLYSKAMEKAATKIVNSLLADMETNKLFAR